MIGTPLGSFYPREMPLAARQQFVTTFIPSQCPALALYTALTALDRASRTKDGKPRRSRANDLIDLQAAAAAATYCDDFITEGGLADQIKQVRKNSDFLGTFKARVFSDLEEYLSAGAPVL